MKIYSRLEQILKFRIYSNSEIPEYLKKLSNMGKLDEVRKQALIILILTVLGEIEDKEEDKKFHAAIKPDVIVVNNDALVQKYEQSENGEEGYLTIKKDGTEVVQSKYGINVASDPGIVYIVPDMPERRKDYTQDVVHVAGTFPCPDCDLVAKSRLGLASHSRKHKK